MEGLGAVVLPVAGARAGQRVLFLNWGLSEDPESRLSVSACWGLRSCDMVTESSSPLQLASVFLPQALTGRYHGGLCCIDVGVDHGREDVYRVQEQNGI